MKTESIRMVLAFVILVMLGANIFLLLDHVGAPKHHGAMDKTEVMARFDSFDKSIEAIRRDLRNLTGLKEDIRAIEEEQIKQSAILEEIPR